MILAISTRVTEAQNYSEKRNSISYEFISYIERLGMTPVIIPNNLKDLDKYLAKFKFNGVVLTGGNNVSSLNYKPNCILTDVYQEREKTEASLFNYALKNKIPVLGICRGFQFINVHLGGSLTHNIADHVNVMHELISDNNMFNKKIVNSYHNQGIEINQLSSSLFPIATTKDKFVEAFESKSMKVLGFQWHPERHHNLFDTNLIVKHFQK